MRSVATEARRRFPYALRAFARSPAYALAMVASLAVGIGGVVAMFTVIDTALLRPIPGIRQPGDLVRIYQVVRAGDRTMRSSLSYPAFTDVRNQSEGSFELAAMGSRRMILTGASGESRRVLGEIVSGDYFQVPK